MPRVVLEAMCMEKAVVATRTGGTVDLIEDRKSGILIPERDPEALSCAVIELLDDGAKRRELAKNARRRIIENFSIREITKKVEAIYYEVL
jgi:glycosyltransferase involved in cell wall biosynthesis